MAPHPLVNQPAPPLSLPDSNGDIFSFTPGTSGVPCALLFYPQSGSYGCTQQACQFRDALAEKDLFKRSKVQVVGVSPDAVDKQKVFVDKQKLTFPILSDSTGEARKAYGVNKGLLGLSDSSRVTFIIDAKGVVRDSLDTTLRYNAHAKFVQKWLELLEQEAKGHEVQAPEAEHLVEPAADGETQSSEPQ